MHSPHDHEHFFRSPSSQNPPTQKPKLQSVKEKEPRRNSDSTLIDSQQANDSEKQNPVHYEDDLVTFDGPDDQENPMNWKTGKKATVTMALGFLTMGATLSSSIFSAAFVQITQEFRISLEVATLGIALYVLAFAVRLALCKVCHRRF